jgi:flagellar hook protein FlgE
MFASFSAALSALNANSTAIDVVGQNLANLNTTGYKTEAISFYDLVTESLGASTGTTQVGYGVGTPITSRTFTQGAVASSSSSLDVAIDGDGFFIAKDASGATLYTRAGDFHVDDTGTLLTATGQKVQGWTVIDPTTGEVDTTLPVTDITFPTGTLKAAVPTTSFDLTMNLNASGNATDGTNKFSKSIEVYDSLGVSHVVTIDFTKSSTTTNTWDYSISVPDSDLNAAFTPVTGTLTFNTDGTLLTPAATDTMPSIQIAGLADGAKDLNVTWNLYDNTTPLVTQYAETSAVSANSQNGVAPSQLVEIGLADGGQVLAKYSDGTKAVVGHLAMASIRNPDSLVSVGENNYAATADTALPAVGLPSTGGRGSVVGSSLESSTVDIATEFTHLIVYQRSYQANAKVITTVDEMSQDTINLKR